MSIENIPIISFFCGCGGFDLGFASTGFDVILALDKDPVAVESYNHNHRRKNACVGDLTKLTADKILEMCRENDDRIPRGVIGGAPCQTYSNGNVHFDGTDSRHHLPRQYAALLKEINAHCNLDFFVFENVKGMTQSRHRKEFAIIKRLFSRAGFHVFATILDAADFGVAQRRARVFLVGLNKKTYRGCKFEFPGRTSDAHLTVSDKLRGLPQPLYFSPGLTRENIPYHPNHWTMVPRSKRFTDGSLKKGKQKGRSFRILSWDKPSMTVAYGNREIHVHPTGKRRLSIYEAMQLQDLPKDYELLGTLSDQVRQVSDAIPPALGRALGMSIRSHVQGVRVRPNAAAYN